MYSVVYVSSATQDFSQQQLVQLLEVSRRNNAAAQITGMLLYKGGNFMQVLEGQREAVQLLYTRIGADPRHTGVLRLLEQVGEERQFAGWSMGFRSVDELPAELQQSFTTLLQGGRSADAAGNNPQRVWKLLQGFRDSMR